VKEYLYRRLVPEVFKTPPSRGMQDVIEVTDPASGRRYQTTRWAARQAEDVAAESKLKNLFGGGALLAGAAGLSMLPMSALRFAWPAAGVMGALGASGLAKGISGYPKAYADTGDAIYGRGAGYPGTELIEKRSGAEDTNIMVRIAMDLAHRPGAKREQVKAAGLARTENLSFDEAAAKLGEVICL
jgi:hypothetical protein